MASTPRQEKIRKARSVADLISIIQEIRSDFDKSEQVVDNIISSLSADEEISFDGRKAPKKPVKTIKFVAPKLSELQKHMTILNSMYNNVLELDAVEAMLRQTFSSNKKAKEALNAVLALRDDVDNKLNDAFDALADIAEKHLPEEVQYQSDRLEKYLINTIKPQTYKEMSKLYYVAPGKEKGELHFATYIGIQELKDSSGFTHGDYYFVLTSVLSKQGMLSFYLNAFPSFKLPASYPLGKEITNENMMKMRADMLLAHNDFVVEQKRLPFPISEDRARALGMPSLKNVENVAIKDDQMVLTLSPSTSKKATVDIASAVIARLRSVRREPSVTFKYTLGTSKGKPAMRFILTPSSERGMVNKDVKLNLSKLEEVRHALDLTDTQVEALKFALQH